jgi:hypothetical protein
MAHPNTHLYCKVTGSFGGNNLSNAEKWSAGFRIGVIGADINYSVAGLQTLANSLHTAVYAFHSVAASLAGTANWFHNVSVARVGPDGKYNPLGQETTWSVGTQVVGTGQMNQPWNTAGNISLRTDNPRGYASNGRFYYPQLVGGLDVNSGRIVPSLQATRIAAIKTMFDAFNTAAAVYAVNARVIVSSATGGVAAVVKQVRIDDRLDSIERRENSQPSVWHTTTLA